MTSRRDRRSVSLGRQQRDRGPRDSSRGPQRGEDGTVVEVSTRHNISNYLLTLQRLQASEDENQQLRRENELLRQRARSHRLSSASFKAEHSTYQHKSSNNSNDNCRTLGSSSNSSTGSKGGGGGGTIKNTSNNNNNSNNTIVRHDAEDEKIAADVKRNSLLFVGDELPVTSSEHQILEAQYKKLQEDFDTVKEFLKHLFQHALTMSSTQSDQTLQLKGKRGSKDINTLGMMPQKQFEQSIEDIYGKINQLKTSQNKQQVEMDQVQQALDNVLCQSSVRNDVTMRIVKQSDKMKELSRQAIFLENQLADASVVVRQAEERSRVASNIASNLDSFVATNGRSLKGNSKEELIKISGRISRLSKNNTSSKHKFAAIECLVNHMTSTDTVGRSFTESKPPAEVVDAMSKLERLIGSDWHRLGRVLALPPDILEEVGKFTTFDLTSRVQKVVTSWAKLNPHRATPDMLKQGLESFDRDPMLLGVPPMSREWYQLPPEVTTYFIAHVVDVPSLITELCGYGVLGADNRNFILTLPQEQRRASRLLHTVTYMGLGALRLCCKALEQLNQNQLANRFKDYLPSEKPQEQQSFLTLDLADRPSTSRRGKNINTRSSGEQNARNAWVSLSSSVQSSVPSSTPPSSSSSSSVANRLSNSASSSGVSSASTSSSASSSTITNNMTSNYTTPPSKQSNNGIPKSSKSSGSSEKQQRKKRSRSLFTRKNKLRDTDPEDPYDDVENLNEYTSNAPQACYNYYHPGINTNALLSSRDAASAAERCRTAVRDSADTEVIRQNDGGYFWNYINSKQGGECNDAQPWVRNPNHQQHHQQQIHHQNNATHQISRSINLTSGADEATV